MMCQQCGGLIAEPGKAYQYAGKLCHCNYSGQRQMTQGPQWVRENYHIPTYILEIQNTLTLISNRLYAIEQELKNERTK